MDALRLLFEGHFGPALTKAGEAHAAGTALIAARAAQRTREGDILGALFALPVESAFKRAIPVMFPSIQTGSPATSGGAQPGRHRGQRPARKTRHA